MHQPWATAWGFLMPITSRRFLQLAPLGRQILGSAGPSMGEVITVADQTLV